MPKNTNILFDISMEAGLEGNTQETKCMSMSCHATKNAGHSYNVKYPIDLSSIPESDSTNQHYIHK
jgi:hypothetical protein